MTTRARHRQMLSSAWSSAKTILRRWYPSSIQRRRSQRFHGNVIVAGSVEAGFRVKASGDINIKGSVEAGSEISAGGSVTVEQGIVGQETSVKAGAVLNSKYAQDARLESAGDVNIASYLHSAFVVAGGSVQVEGSGGGGIVGGETWAKDSIRVCNVGSEGNSGTKLNAGLEPTQLSHLQEIRSAIRTAEDMLARLLSTSGLESFDEEEIDKLAGHSESRQEAVKQVLAEAKQHNELRDSKQGLHADKHRMNFSACLRRPN